MNLDITTETPMSACVECGHGVDRVAGPSAPAEGDLTLCIKCGSLNAFTADLKLRQPTLDEYLTVAADSEFQQARKAINTLTGRLTSEWNALTPNQRMVMTAAWEASDGWIMKGASACWYRAPTAVAALIRKGYLHMPPHGRKRARLTDKGRAVIATARLGGKP
jgi:hypothetical protein